MHRQVYGHKTRIATDIMATRALKYGIEDGLLPAEAYTLDSVEGKAVVTDEFIQMYFGETDTSVMQRLLAHKGESIALKLADRLRRRDLIRRSATIALHHHRHEIGAQQLTKILERSRFELRRPDLEREIAEALGFESYLVALYVDNQVNPTYRGPGTQINAGDIMLARRDGPPDTFESESEIFNEEIGNPQIFVHLYTPALQEHQLEQAKEQLWEALKRV
jgi:HD superfamily phosphohydrolase